MANHIFILIAVMLLAGVFGGLVNFYMHGQHDPDTTSLPRCLVVGVGAAFLVPVILDLVNSELILESQGDPTRLLIFTGFCLIASIASRLFIVNVSDRILSEAHSAKERSETLQHDLRIIKHELMPLIETETEQDLAVEDQQAGVVPEDELDVTTSNVLKTLGSGRFIFRSLAGLCHEMNLDESTMMKTLNIMVSRNLAGRISGKNGMRWHITEKGRRSLEATL